MKSIEKIKKELDYINYGLNHNQNIYDYFDYEKNVFFKKYEISDVVKNEFKVIKNILDMKNEPLKDNEKYHIGTISVGAHSIDYASIYNFNISSKWRKTPVMYVFENPSNNIGSSFAENIENAIDSEQKSIDEQIKTLQSKVLWRAEHGVEYYKENDTEYGSGKFKHFGQYSYYDQLVLSIILEFKLANLYTTNMFRYEIFQGNENEAFLNIDRTYGLFGSKKDEVFDLENENNSFVKELNIVEPKIIFATYKPYIYLEGYCKKNDIVLVKVLHPTSHTTNKDRFFSNFTKIILGLYEAGVIKEEERNEKITKAMEIMKKF